MKKNHYARVFVALYVILALFLQLPLAAAQSDTLAIYLTWQHHPESTMTICWITNLDSQADTVTYHRKGENEWKSVSGSHVSMPERFPFWIHTTELTGLLPDTEYYFKLPNETNEHKFKTWNNDVSKPIRFIVGGDIYHDGLDVLEKMNRQAAKLDPLFAVLGGDLAYADTKPSTLPNLTPRWLDWLQAWSNQMKAPDGRLIPMIPVIGNHDVKKKMKNRIPSDAPFFYALFPYPGPVGYNVLDFGKFLSLFTLDSNHTNPVSGKQTQWLQSVLESRQQVPHKFAVYHVGAFPSYRPFFDVTNGEIRQYWVPLFENYGISTVFEHHDHAYKRTWPLYQGKVNMQQGVLYLGDGAWAVETPRTPKTPESTWYLAKTKASRHVILGIIHGNESHFMAIDDDGNVIDEVLRIRP